MSQHRHTDPVGTSPTAPVDPHRGQAPLVGLILIGCAVSLSLGAYGRVHAPTYSVITTLGFATLLDMKAWLTTGAACLGVVQVLTGARMYGRLGHGPSPRAVATIHRVSGMAAVLLTLPVAFQCLWSLGFQTYSTRVLLHSLAGCAFYGVLVTKLLALRTRRLPTWAIPVLGGALVTVLVTLWLTSSLWYFTHGSPGHLVVHRSDSYRAQQPSWVGPGSCQLRTRCGGQPLTASR